ncbi:MAG: oligopeptide/dipeptide ABC transporter ATP-binding protein [bacterium]
MLLQVKELKKYFHLRKGLLGKADIVRAVDNISFDLEKGKTLGLVGESGCGKSTTSKLILRLLASTSGKVYFEDEDIFNLNKDSMRHLRQQMQLVFQNPYGCLNPRMQIGDIIGEPLIIHRLAKGRQKKEKIAQLLQLVGLSPDWKNRYPHEFSGGQLQRIGIARALATSPKLIILDEPVSSLDVSIQAQIINLLCDLQEELRLTYIFISHDLRIVRQISDRVAVMYLGKIVELATTAEIYSRAVHPYTQKLLASILLPNPQMRKKMDVLADEVPSPINPPAGCRFHPRCEQAKDECKENIPELKRIKVDHFVACHLMS